MRVITDELHTALIKILVQDPKVAVFQQLLLAQKLEPAEQKDTENKG